LDEQCSPYGINAYLPDDRIIELIAAARYGGNPSCAEAHTKKAISCIRETHSARTEDGSSIGRLHILPERFQVVEESISYRQRLANQLVARIMEVEQSTGSNFLGSQ
jgi:hypothetical protein